MAKMFDTVPVLVVECGDRETQMLERLRFLFLRMNETKRMSFAGWIECGLLHNHVNSSRMEREQGYLDDIVGLFVFGKGAG